jgi:hypothetical protein
MSGMGATRAARLSHSRERCTRSCHAPAGNVPIRDNPGTFDDKAIIVEASNRNQPRGAASPLLMDPAARPVGSPHAFYVTDPAERALVVKFLKSLDDKPLP